MKIPVILSGNNYPCVLYYTTKDDKMLDSITSSAFDVDIESHSYDNIGKIVFKQPPTIIKASAFKNCDSIEQIAIPSNIVTIEDFAFSGCYNMYRIIMPNCTTEIGSYAFCGCKSLKDITLPNNLTEIKCLTFAGCSNLTNIEIPDNVTTIQLHAFLCCENLTYVTILNHATHIEKDAFACCNKLKEVDISSSAQVDVGAFPTHLNKRTRSYRSKYYGRRHYEQYRGYYAQDVAGYSDEDINDIFDGCPEAYWNID